MRRKAITIWDERTEKVKAVDMKIGSFYRVVHAPRKERIGALACRTGRNTVCCWVVDQKIAFTVSILDACEDCLYVEARKFSICKEP